MKHSLIEAVERMAGLGYTGIEIMADVPHAWPETMTPQDIARIREALDRASLAISNVNAFMMNAVQDFWHPSWIEPGPSDRRRRIDHTKRALTMARHLGAPSITTEPGGPLEAGMSRNEAMDVFVDGLQEALEHAEREDVLLLVEPEPELLIENTDQFLELAERIDSPALGLNFDIGHFYCVGESLPEAVAKMADHTRHYHVEDIAATRVHQHLIPGTGAIDFAAVIRAIRQTGYAEWMTVELYPYLDDPDGAGRASLELLNRLLEES
jgi:sugar phosphate isomerase/epimerase